MVRLGFKDNGFSIETVVQKDFIWWQSVDVGVAKNETTVHVADVTDKQVMVVENGFEVCGPNLFADGDHQEPVGKVLETTDCPWGCHVAGTCNVVPSRKFACSVPW